jgi:hypothetical protein
MLDHQSDVAAVRIEVTLLLAKLQWRASARLTWLLFVWSAICWHRMTHDAPAKASDSSETKRESFILDLLCSLYFSECYTCKDSSEFWEPQSIHLVSQHRLIERRFLFSQWFWLCLRAAETDRGWEEVQLALVICESMEILRPTALRPTTKRWSAIFRKRARDCWQRPTESAVGMHSSCAPLQLHCLEDATRLPDWVTKLRLALGSYIPECSQGISITANTHLLSGMRRCWQSLRTSQSLR